MDLPTVLPTYTKAKVSAKGRLNKEDLATMGRNALVFLTPTILLYLAQLSMSLTGHIVLSVNDIIPTPQVVGAFEGYLIATFIDYLRKLNNGKI